MGKIANDVEDLLGEDTKAPAKAKAKAKAPAKAEPAPKGKAKAKAEPAPKGKAKAPAEDKPKREREPVVFEEGEKEKLMKSVEKAIAKGEMNSRDVAEKLGIPTRKLRPVLYSLERAGSIVLTPSESRATGMFVAKA